MSTIAIEQQQRDRRTGAIGTVLFHVLLFLLFLFFGLKQPDPLPQEHHIPIELAMEGGGGGGGVLAPQPGTPAPAPAPASPSEEQPEDVATEEESPVVAPKPVKPKKTDPKPATPEPPKPNPNALFTPSTNPATTTQTGDPGGNTSTGPGSGGGDGGGTGGGIGSFRDKGFEGYIGGNRGLVKTPGFRNDNTEAGKVAVDIRVDPSGKVIYAKGRIGAPTTTTSSQLHALAEGYAKQFSFTANPGASNDQAGFIVFTFTLQ